MADFTVFVEDVVDGVVKDVVLKVIAEVEPHFPEDEVEKLRAYQLTNLSQTSAGTLPNLGLTTLEQPGQLCQHLLKLADKHLGWEPDEDFRDDNGEVHPTAIAFLF
jgi:hypothetical protein